MMGESRITEGGDGVSQDRKGGRKDNERLCVKIRDRVRRCKKVGRKIGEKMKGWHMLRQAKLKETEGQIVLGFVWKSLAYKRLRGS